MDLDPDEHPVSENERQALLRALSPIARRFPVASVNGKPVWIDIPHLEETYSEE